MRIAIYAIAYNEAKFAERFCTTCKAADLVLVGDTGSTDDTVKILQDNGAHVAGIHQRPWRFDIPRNAVLSLLPADIDLCIRLDIDEVMVDGWRDHIENRWKVGEHHRLRCRFVHNFKPDGSYGTVGLKEFGHQREGYIWRHAVHEKFYWIGEGEERTCQIEDFVIEHRQDMTKNRSSYLPLMELEAREPTVTARHIFWLGREYTYYEQWAEAEQTLLRYLTYAETWPIEKSYAMQLLGKATSALGRHDEALAWHMKAVQEAPKQREPWMALAWYWHASEDWPQTFAAVSKAISITTRPEHYLTREDCWNEKPYDLGALCAHKLGMQSKAQEYIKVALKMNPDDARLKHSAKVVGLHV